jgi:hypothetical protein
VHDNDDRAEQALDPLSPCGASQDEQRNVLANKEYKRLLDVARGIAEPQAEDDDDDDEDFVPPPSEDGEPEDQNDVVDDDEEEEEPPESVSVSRQELSELIAETNADNAAKKPEAAPLKKKKISNSVPVSTALQTKTAGFSRDQCVQLQVSCTHVCNNIRSHLELILREISSKSNDLKYIKRQ